MEFFGDICKVEVKIDWRKSLTRVVSMYHSEKRDNFYARYETESHSGDRCVVSLVMGIRSMADYMIMLIKIANLVHGFWKIASGGDGVVTLVVQVMDLAIRDGKEDRDMRTTRKRNMTTNIPMSMAKNLL